MKEKLPFWAFYIGNVVVNSFEQHQHQLTREHTFGGAAAQGLEQRVHKAPTQAPPTESEILTIFCYFWAASAAKNCKKKSRDPVGR